MIFIVCVNIRTRCNQILCNGKTLPFRSVVQWCVAKVIKQIDVIARFDELFDARKIAVACCEV